MMVFAAGSGAILGVVVGVYLAVWPGYGFPADTESHLIWVGGWCARTGTAAGLLGLSLGLLGALPGTRRDRAGRRGSVKT
jgi:hypothetical protein